MSGVTNRNQHSGKLTDTWLTPKRLIDALGPFDTDAATPDGGMPWRTARRMVTKSEDNLTLDWGPLGYVWLNPPFGPEQWPMLRKLATESRNGIALIRARTNVKAFHDHVFKDGPLRATAVFWFAGVKITFHDGKGKKAKDSDPWPHVLLCYGRKAVASVRRAIRGGHIRGTLTEMKERKPDANAAQKRK